MMQDEGIIELYFQRDERALLETTDKYGNYCKSIAQNIVKDEETAKECFNDTLYTSWNIIPPKRPNPLRIFLGKITRNLSLRRWEKEHALKRGGGEPDVAIEELAECLADEAARKAEQIEDSLVIREVINNFLAGLSKQNRRIFVRRYWYMSSVKEIAKALSMTEGNVMTNLSRSRAKLKEALEKAGIVL